MKKMNPQKYNYYSYNPTLFDSLHQIPIQMFNKPEDAGLDLNSSCESDEEKSEK